MPGQEDRTENLWSGCGQPDTLVPPSLPGVGLHRRTTAFAPKLTPKPTWPQSRSPIDQIIFSWWQIFYSHVSRPINGSNHDFAIAPCCFRRTSAFKANIYVDTASSRPPDYPHDWRFGTWKGLETLRVLRSTFLDAYCLVSCQHYPHFVDRHATVMKTRRQNGGWRESEDRYRLRSVGFLTEIYALFV